MKKYFLVVFAVIFLSSCEEDVRFNNPSFQGLKDNFFWRADQSQANIGSDGSLVVKAFLGRETITLKMVSTALQTYYLGVDDANNATYILTSSGYTSTFSSGAGIGNGQIVITEYDDLNKTVSGTFKFNLENVFNDPLTGAMLNFQQGVFYKVPVKTDLTP
jgi:hypothetical protein